MKKLKIDEKELKPRLIETNDAFEIAYGGVSSSGWASHTYVRFYATVKWRGREYDVEIFTNKRVINPHEALGAPYLKFKGKIRVCPSTIHGRERDTIILCRGTKVVFARNR